MIDFLQAKNISFFYNEDPDQEPYQVFDDLSINIEKGSLVAILGHNGCGKSTLAKHFNAILIPQKGEVFVEDINTIDEDRVYDIRKNVGMVFQNPDNQIVSTIVEEDVAFGLENMGVESSEIRRRVDKALEDVGMSEYKLHAPHQLSGGQKQRIAIAGIIAMCPKCIVLDEPTAMLDPRGRKEVINTVKVLNKEFGITVIIITHYMDEASQCDRVVVMDKGKIILDDIPKYVFSKVDILKSVGLDVPQTTELMYELRKMGYKVADDVLTEDECVEEILKIMEDVK